MTDDKRTARAGGPWFWRIGLSAGAELWERLWRAFWPPFAVACLFVSLALFGVFALVPGWLHAAALAAFALAAALLLWREVRSLRLPDYVSARRRLERVNALPHRPLETLDDEVVGGAGADPVARALWNRHQQKVREAVSGLRVGLPRPRLIRRDPLALRVALVLMLVLGGLVAGPDAPTRLAEAFTPQFGAVPGLRATTLDAWVTPPGYTGRPPVFLAGASRSDGQGPVTGPIEVPQGSVLVAQVGGVSGAPDISGAKMPDGTEPFELVAQDSYRAKVPLEESGRVAVLSGGRELDAWDITVTPDAAPTVAFLREPGKTPLSALRIDYEAHDDYGLSGVTATIRRPDGPAVTDETITFELPLPGINQKDAAGTGYQDLTPHPWAGLPVQIQLVARDGRGQRGVSGAISTVLPERVFNHPVARRIIEERKKLTADPAGARDAVGAALTALAWKAEDYDNDVTVFLALTTASQRLKYSSSTDAIAAIQQLLWDTALRLEDGNLSIASRELRELQKKLMEALSGDATDEELQRLMDELEAAMNELLDALAEQQQQSPDMENMPLDPNTTTIDRQELQALFDRMRELLKGGARDAARQMLSELQNLMENLQAGQMGQMPPQFQKGMETLERLQDLVEAQQELLDRTYDEAQRRAQEGQRGQQGQEGQQQGQQGQPGQRGMPGQQGQRGQPGQGQRGQPGQGQQGQQGQASQGSSADVTLQEALRRQLGEVMRQLGEMTGEIPRPLGRAEGAMRRSTQALGSGQPGAAVPPQTEALDQLRQGAQAATEQMMQQFGGGMQARTGMGRRPGQPFGGPQDPFGRRTDGSQGFTQGDVEIPSESDLQRARRILEELRRRAGERERPPVERDYIDRLLKPY